MSKAKTAEKDPQLLFKEIRRASVPLVLWESFDPAATVAECRKTLKAKAGQPTASLLAWDYVSGLVGLNDAGTAAIAALQIDDMNLVPVLKALQKLPEIDGKACVFFHQIHRYFEEQGVLQGIWLLRDKFKAKTCTAVMFWNGGKLPSELCHDVIEVKEVAPSPEMIIDRMEEITKPFATAAGPFPYEKEKAADGLKGLLSMFDVEQTFCLNLSKDGVNVKGLWERKIARLKGSTGAEITIDNPTFADLSGCANVKSELQGFIDGQQRPGVVLFMDEVEKMFGGAGTDLSGTTTNMLGQFLTWTQDRRVRGFLLAGIPGAGKSWTGACAAGQAGVPFFKLNINEAKGSLVGQSEQQMKQALAAVDAISGGNVLLIASCNWVDQLTPDIMARFTMGTYFYDFPSEEERRALLAQYFDKYKIPSDGETEALQVTKGWVGREIENACFKAWQYKRTFGQVAKNIAPSCVSQKDKLEALRLKCSGRFLSASSPGMFQYQASDKVTGKATLDDMTESVRRTVNLAE